VVVTGQHQMRSERRVCLVLGSPRLPCARRAKSSVEESGQSIRRKDECQVRLKGREHDYWMSTEVGMLGGYGFQGQVTASDCSDKQGKMGAGYNNLRRKNKKQHCKVGREEEGSSSNQPELAAFFLALCDTLIEEQLLYLCDNQSLLKAVTRWIGEGLISMADTLELLELYEESQVAMQEARVIGKRAQNENITSPLHLHQQICACTKDTMDARRELDDHTSTLHVGSKIRLHGPLNQTLTGKKGIVLGTAINNRIGIQLQGEQRQVSIRILNIRYWGDLEQDCHALYDKMAAKAQVEIELLKVELKIQIKKSGNKNIDTARA